MSPQFKKRLISSLHTAMISSLLLTLSCAAFAEKAVESEPFGFRSETKDAISGEINEPFKYQGKPVFFGSFRIWPNLTLQQEYDDNILATENNTESDFVSIIKPELEIWKSFGRHNFSLLMNSEIKRFWDNEDENIENHSIALKGNLEARKVLNIPVTVTYRDGHISRKYQRRSSPTQLVESPLNVKRFEAGSGFVYKPNRFSLSLLGDYRQTRLKNEDLIGGGTIIRDNRNVNSTNFTGKVSYELQKGITPYLQLSHIEDDYINEIPGATTRDNKTLKTLIGANFNFKDLITGFIAVGMDKKSYKASNASDTNDTSLDASITWEPTAKTRLGLTANRETKEDNLLVAQLTQTSFGFNAQHELQKDLFASADIFYSDDKFDDLNRHDKSLESGFEILKILSPRFQIGAGYNYLIQNSSIQGLDFNNSVVFLKAKIAL